MKVLVTGGTGFVGTSIVNRLLQRGHAVAVLARDPRKTRNRYNHAVETVAGNVLDPASLAAAAAGRDAVVHLVGIINEKGDQTFDRMHREATENVIAAAKAAGVKRYVHMSAMGSSRGFAVRVRADQGGGREGGARVGPRLDDLPALDRLRAGRRVRVAARADRALESGLHPGHRPGHHASSSPSRSPTSPACSPRPSRSRRPSARASSWADPRSFRSTTSTAKSPRRLESPANRSSTFPLWYGRILASAFEWLARRGVFSDPPLTRDQLRSLSRDNAADTSETAGGLRRRLEERSGPASANTSPRGGHDPRSGIGGETHLESRAVLRIR